MYLPPIKNPLSVQMLGKCLIRWYRRHRRPLPWRDNPTPYRVWISEIMLQQTQARTVIPYFMRFLERFPDVNALAAAPEREVVELWAGLGYYTRARNLHRAAKLIHEKHGEFPRDLKAILELPGIGRYTAGAICSLAFNQVQPVVDGNVRRVITRLEGMESGKNDSFFWNRMSEWIPARHPAEFNQAMMELGATVCLPSKPLCSLCPVEEACKARRLGIQDTIPAVRTKHAVQQIQVVILILEAGGKILLTSIRKVAFIPGEWGLPCSRIRSGESGKEAAEKLCCSILGRSLPVKPYVRISHSITHYRIKAHGFFWRGDLGSAELRKGDAFRWADRAGCGRLLTSSLFRKTLLKYGASNVS